MAAEASRTLAIEIAPSCVPDLEMMRDLGALDQALREADVNTAATHATLPGVKNLDLTTVIAVSSLALSAVSTLVTVLSYWSSQRPKYTVTLKSNAAIHTLAGLDKHGIANVIRELETEENPGEISVRVEAQ